eukprot:1359222-Pleurochrysis_carterae.AAC.1
MDFVSGLSREEAAVPVQVSSLLPCTLHTEVRASSASIHQLSSGVVDAFRSLCLKCRVHHLHEWHDLFGEMWSDDEFSSREFRHLRRKVE